MAWAPGALSRIVADLLNEIGGGPEGPGVTIDQITDHVVKRPPPGVRYGAIRKYAKVFVRAGRGKGLHEELIIHDDGAQGIDILADSDGRPWFTERQAIRWYFGKTLLDCKANSGWLVREHGRWKIASIQSGPRVTGLGTYNSHARQILDGTDRGHAAYVNAKTALKRLDDPGLAAGVMHTITAGNGDAYHKRRADWVRAVDALSKVTDPAQMKELKLELAGLL